MDVHNNQRATQTLPTSLKRNIKAGAKSKEIFFGRVNKKKKEKILRKSYVNMSKIFWKCKEFLKLLEGYGHPKAPHWFRHLIKGSFICTHLLM